MRKFNAFTLAEVLITLGIIGVVAAMTMPTLINQTNGAQYKAAYKKALSAIAQGITLNVALDDKSFADATVASAAENTPAESLAGYLKSRMNVVNLTETVGYPLPNSGSFSYEFEYSCEEADTTNANHPCKGKTAGAKVTNTGSVTPSIFMFFNDSSMFAFDKTKTSCTSAVPCYGIVDVNGAKGPNKVVEENKTPTDIYPVAFYDQTIRPASAAASAVLYGK